MPFNSQLLTLNLLTILFCIGVSFPDVVSVNGTGGGLNKINSIQNSEGFYISAIGVAECFKVTCVFSAEKRKMVFNVNNTDIVLTEGNPFAIIGDSVVNMLHAPFMENGDLYVEAEPLLSFLDPMLPEKLIFSKVKKSIFVIQSGVDTTKTTQQPQIQASETGEKIKTKPISSENPQIPTTNPANENIISKASCEERKNGTLFTLYLPDSVAFDHTFFKPQLNINIFKGKISVSDINITTVAGLVTSVEATQFADNAQVSITVSDKVPEPEVAYLKDPLRIEVVVRPAGSPDIKAGPEKSMQNQLLRPSSSEPSAKEAKERIRTIIIDPGHGGKDPGAVSSTSRLREKDAVLAIGKKVAALLKEKSPDVRCVMTRDDDTFIALSERIHIANKQKGDLFVSIHANSIKGNKNKKSSVNGYTVYFLDVARDDEARAVAAFENSSLEYEEDRKDKSVSDLDFILKSTELNLYRNESEDFAITLEQEMNKSVKEIKRNKTGINQAGFYVLRGPDMPAVLIETAYISNPRESEMLGNPGFQDEVAQSIINGIIKYKAGFKRTTNE